MEKRYYAGIRLQEDLAMCRIYDELEKDSRFEITASGKNVEVVEMEYISAHERKETGKTHIGFDFNYINVKYKEFILNIETASFYPFIDDNNPAQINATPFLIIGKNKRIQTGYRFPAMSANEIVEYVEKHYDSFKRPLKDVYVQRW